MGFKLTEQQHDAIQYFHHVTPNNALVVESRAGCGKSTLIEHGCRDNLQSRILLLCFNKPIAVAAEARMPANVTCKTFAGWTWNAPLSNGFSDSTYGRVYGHRVSWRFDSKKFANLFRVDVSLIHTARAAIDYFVSTSDQYLTKYHVPKRLWIGKPKQEQESFKEEVVSIARRLWRMKLEKSNKLMPVLWNDITKMVQIERDIQRTDRYEYVIVDEAQDITACVLDLIMQKASPTILVGDSLQQLYQFIFTIDAMNKIGGTKKYLTESQRFDQTLANEANTVLDLLQGDFPKIVGNGQKTEIRKEIPSGNYTVLCRTNMGLLSESLAAIRNRKKIHVMGNIMDSVKQLESGYFLSIGQPDRVTHPSLLGVKDWNEVEVMKETDSDMALLFRQVTRYGAEIPNFCEELENAGTVAECKADVVLSTVHKCVHPNTLVETKGGLMRIRDIQDDGLIATPDGVREYFDKFTREECDTLVLTTNRGYQIEVTPEHGLTVYRNGKHLRVNADEITKGDLMRVSLESRIDVTEYVDSPLFEGTLGKRTVVHSLPKAVNESFGEFLGLMVADGTVYTKGFKLSKRHLDVAERFRDLVKELFGYDSKYFEIGVTPGYDVCSLHIANWLRSIGGLSPNDKYVPDVILGSPLTVQAAFLRGLFEDGTVNMKNDEVDHIHFESKTESLCRTVQVMLLRFGIISTVKSRCIEGKRSISTVYIYGENLHLFAEKIGFISQWKNNRLVNLRSMKASIDFVPITIDEISEIRKYINVYEYQNVRAKLRISRHKASIVIERSNGDKSVDFLVDRMKWHYDPVYSIEKSRSETMCITVPDGSKFIQNGFDGWNSKGREWDKVKMANDFQDLVYFSEKDRRYKVKKFEVYTTYVALTRAKQVLYPNNVLGKCKGWMELL